MWGRSAPPPSPKPRRGGKAHLSAPPPPGPGAGARSRGGVAGLGAPARQRAQRDLLPVQSDDQPPGAACVAARGGDLLRRAARRAPRLFRPRGGATAARRSAVLPAPGLELAALAPVRRARRRAARPETGLADPAR